VDLLAADKRKICDVIVDHICDVGGGHGDWVLVVLVALSRGVVVLISDGSGFWSAYMLICLPGSNDN
jgi:hypothetical protein